MSGSTVRPPAYQLLADELRDDITSGRLRPGDRLPPEPELCVRTGVSRSTVREALRLLASQHLIITTRGVTGGSFVAHPDAEQLSNALSTGMTLLTNTPGVGLADLLELRRAIEVPAAGLAAARRTSTHLAELNAALFNPAKDDLDVMVQAHTAFHAGVAKATGNPLFELVARPLYHVSYGENVIGNKSDGYWDQITADHKDLLDCLTRQDVQGATTTARRHLDYILAHS